MKKAISLVLSLLMLTALFAVPVSAADTVFDSNVVNSITEEDETGLGLAFLYTINLQNTTVTGTRTFAGAEAVVDGETVRVVKMGAVVANTEEAGTDEDAMTLENVNGVRLLNVEAKWLWDWTADQCQYAVRITNIPAEHNKTQLYARPYYVVEDAEGVQSVVYGAIANKSYFSVWCDNQPEVTLPAVGSDIDVVNKRNRIRVYNASIVDRTVTLIFRNYTSNWITEETNWVAFTCYDADGNVIPCYDPETEKEQEQVKIYIGVIDTKKNKSKSFTFDVPDNTAEVRLVNSKIVYWTEWS